MHRGDLGHGQDLAVLHVPRFVQLGCVAIEAHVVGRAHGHRRFAGREPLHRRRDRRAHELDVRGIRARLCIRIGALHRADVGAVGVDVVLLEAVKHLLHGRRHAIGPDAGHLGVLHALPRRGVVLAGVGIPAGFQEAGAALHAPASRGSPLEVDAEPLPQEPEERLLVLGLLDVVDVGRLRLHGDDRLVLDEPGDADVDRLLADVVHGAHAPRQRATRDPGAAIAMVGEHLLIRTVQHVEIPLLLEELDLAVE
jgi:hypothetical protein